MIFYFSGTGNSLYAAKNIGQQNKEKLISIASMMKSKSDCYEYTLEDNEAIGFVYPVYAWAPPKMVLEFIGRLKLNNYKNNYIFSVATCGDNIGDTMKLLDISLKKKNMTLKSGFSVKMPNNYIILSNVDSKEKEKKKLLEAKTALKSINKVIKDRQEGIFKIKKGFIPGILTSVINPMFNKKAISTKGFYANDKCTGCKLCERVCNCRSIKVEGKPTWGKDCSQCLACIHFCPMTAIQYGKGTEKKGRYRNPNISANEMII